MGLKSKGYDIFSCKNSGKGNDNVNEVLHSNVLYTPFYPTSRYVHLWKHPISKFLIKMPKTILQILMEI